MLLEEIGRLMANYVFGMILTVIFYWLGWVMLQPITLGKYPPSLKEKHNRTGVTCFGFVAIMATYTQISSR